MSVQGACRTMVNTQHKHSGRGVPSCGMAERPRGLPQRRRKPHPSKSNTAQLEPTGKRRRNNNRGLRSQKRTEERKLKRRTVSAWSRTLYKYHRGNTLAGQARPGRTNKLAHENTRTQFKEFKQAMKAATSKGATSTRAVGQRAHTKGTEKNKGKQRRGRAQNEATITSGRTLKVACLNVQGFTKSPRDSPSKNGHSEKRSMWPWCKKQESTTH